METSRPPQLDEVMLAGMSHVLKEEDLLAKTWSAQDRAEHALSVRESVEQTGNLRQRLGRLRARTDSVWERFVTLTLERALSGQLRQFLDEIDLEMQESSQQLVELDCEIDRLRARVQERRRCLEEKITVLEPLAHRTSTQNHLSMMLARVEGLEAYLSGKQDAAPEAGETHDKRQTNVSSDLLYLRVRLLTTRIAIFASSRGKQISDCDTELVSLLPEIERLKADFAVLAARIDSMNELSRYWLAYLDIAVPEREP